MTGCQPYPFLRMAFNISFLMSLGTLYAFSVWSHKFVRGPFAHWTPQDLQFVYSCGVFGAFASPFGGYLYDNIGPRTTYLVGLFLAILGYSCIYLVGMNSAAIAGPFASDFTVVLVGAAYGLEELGSGTIYIAIALDTLKHFPERYTSTSMGLVGLGYSMSSIVSSLVLPQLHVDLWTMFAGLAAAMTMFTVLRVLVLGDAGISASSAAKEGGSISLYELVMMPRFLALSSVCAFLQGPAVAFLGFASVVGDSLVKNGSGFAQASCISNVLGRIVFGAGYDYFRSVPPQTVLSALSMASLFGYFMLASSSLSTFGGGSLQPWFGCCLVQFCFGASAPLMSVYIKDNFHSGSVGNVLGVVTLAAAFGSFLFGDLFAPTSDEAQGLLHTFAAAGVMSLMASSAMMVDKGTFTAGDGEMKRLNVSA